VKPYVDRGISLIGKPETIVIGAPSDDTLGFDEYRQGIEVTNIKYFLRSNIPYMSSKGLSRGSVNNLVDHELDYVNFGQGMNLDGFKPYDEQNETKNAVEVLKSNLIQSDEDPYYGRSSQDGEVDIFSDTGKRSLLPDAKNIKSRGIRTSFFRYGGLYSLTGVTRDYYLDSADVYLDIPAPGYAGNDVSFNPFDDKINMNAFGQVLDYSYVGPNEKSPATGNDYYGSTSGTDSIAYGGFLR